MTSSASLQAPHNEKKILLHCCCAPCSCSIIQRMLDAGLEPTLFFYNPNIYPPEEYTRRKGEVLRYAKKKGVPVADTDYEPETWLEKTKGYEAEAERGKRCDLCFEMRLGKAAAYAAAHGFKVFTTSLGISRWKDLAQVNRAGERAAALFPGLTYWAHNWRLQGGQEQMEQISREESFYRQRYCGCLYSLRESIRRGLTRLSENHPAR
ncbi:MAG TPA: epoxyqueuosine reductase QueH [Candidatus Omnitrophota bacterium]|nr:epoxyqueuosine reductase QueH [Candidatus Omnitrophota bacterium]HRY84986.1 epoxyqueuosine reductase QueH [Candidatus Omnitrophota bacterium]